MTQEAMVIRVVDSSSAEIEVKRGTACGGMCSSCGGTCAFQNKIKMIAKNKVRAKVGDTVIISSHNASVLGAALFLYIFPLITFAAAYIIASLCGLREGPAVLVSMLGLFAGIGIIVLEQRIRKNSHIEFDIIDVKKR